MHVIGDNNASMKTIGQFLLPTHYRTASYLRPIDPGWQLGHNRTFSMRSSDAEKFEDPGRQKVNYKSAVKSHKWTISWVAFLLAFEAYATAGVYLSIFTLIVNLVFRLPFHLWRWKVSKLGSVDYIYRCLALIFVSICIISYGIHMGSVLKERARLVSTAVEQFRSREGIYPSSLEALVPKDLAELPPGYRYLHSKDGDPYLYYPSNLAPRPVVYDFKKKSWEQFD